MLADPVWMQGDPAAFSNSWDGVQEVECECGWVGEVGTTEDTAGEDITWVAEWKCPSCDESHTSEGWYEAQDPDTYYDQMREDF